MIAMRRSRGVCSVWCWGGDDWSYYVVDDGVREAKGSCTKRFFSLVGLTRATC